MFVSSTAPLGAIDHGNVAGEHSDARHALAVDPHSECRRRVFDQQFIEVQGSVEIVVRRRREARRNGTACQRDKLPRPVGRSHSNDPVVVIGRHSLKSQ
jgi:hypothetical protein